MKVEVVKQGSLFRLVNPETNEIVITANNKPADGGGHSDEAKAIRQAGYINAALEKVKKGE